MLILKEEWATHPKMRKAVFLAGTPSIEHFWFRCVSGAASGSTDGVLEPWDLLPIAQACGISDPQQVERFTRALIDCWVEPRGAGLFHDAESLANCVACKDMLRTQGHKPSAEAIVVHDFLDHNPSKRNKTPIGRKREKRKNGLNRRYKHLRVEAYERDHGLCRYCGRRPNPDPPYDNPDSLEIDHVDPACFTPNDGNFLDNLVVACRRCNRAKGEQTPIEAGMPRLQPGITTQDVAAGNGAWLDEDIPDVADARGKRSPEGGRAGSGTVRSGIGPGSARAGSGRGPGRGGPGKGRGRGGAGAATGGQARPP